MHNASDTKYYNIDSIMIYDPSTTYLIVQDNIPGEQSGVQTWC